MHRSSTNLNEFSSYSNMNPTAGNNNKKVLTRGSSCQPNSRSIDIDYGQQTATMLYNSNYEFKPHSSVHTNANMNGLGNQMQRHASYNSLVSDNNYMNYTNNAMYTSSNPASKSQQHLYLNSNNTKAVPSSQQYITITPNTSVNLMTRLPNPSYTAKSPTMFLQNPIMDNYMTSVNYLNSFSNIPSITSVPTSVYQIEKQPSFSILSKQLLTNPTPSNRKTDGYLFSIRLSIFEIFFILFL
jgi:hypothetical protein